MYTYYTVRNIELSQTEPVGTSAARATTKAWKTTLRLLLKIAALKDPTMPTMTTEILQFSQDMSLDNDIYVLSVRSKCVLSGLALGWENWEDKLETTGKAIDSFSSKLFAAFPHGKNWLFIGHKNWQPKNRIVRYRKLWGALEAQGIVIQNEMRMSEVLVEGDAGIKYFGMVRCDDIQPNTLATILRSGWETQLIFTDEFTAMTASANLFQDGWEHVGNAPSDKIVNCLCDLDMFAYLPLGWYDDRESGCAVIAREKLIRILYSESALPTNQLQELSVSERGC